LTICVGVLGAAIGLLSLAGTANSQVIEIQPDGGSAVYSGPVRSVDGRREALTEGRGGAAGRGTAFHLAARDQTLADAMRETADRRQVSAQLIEAVAWAESRFNQAAVSPKGARGVMQLMPGTAQTLGVDARDERGNVDGGGAYLAALLKQYDGDIILTLAAYNAGPDAVRKWGGVPPYPETRAYVAAVLDHLAGAASRPGPRRGE
jgi:soluble lytic murein transglycosylase-like protein